MSHAANSPNINPYCAPRWPYCTDRADIAARLHEAVTAANTLAGLIHADLCMADERNAACDPEELPVPFSPATAFGLRMALLVCLEQVQAISETLERAEIRLPVR